MGAICGSATPAALDHLTAYGEAIGLMFQIVDDLLDIEQTAEHTGKRRVRQRILGYDRFSDHPIEQYWDRGVDRLADKRDRRRLQQRGSEFAH